MYFHPQNWTLNKQKASNLLLDTVSEGFQDGASSKEPPCQGRRLKDWGLICDSGRSPEGGHDNPLKYSCLENPMDRGVWWATVHRVAESDMTEAT